MEQTVTTVFKFGAAIALATGAFVASVSNAATLSAEEFKEYAPEEAYWVVSVNCEDGSDSRVIQRKTDGNKWCGKDIDGFCFDTKDQAAESVCGTEYGNKLDQIKQSEAAKQRETSAQKQAAEKAENDRRQAQARAASARQQAAEAKRQNQIKIDEQLLKIEQEKLSLRRQELELQRRAVEIRESLEKLGNS